MKNISVLFFPFSNSLTNLKTLEEVDFYNVPIDLEKMKRDSLIIVIDESNKKYNIIKARISRRGIYEYKSVKDLIDIFVLNSI